MSNPYYEYCITRCGTDGNYSRQIVFKSEHEPHYTFAVILDRSVQSVERITHVSDHEIEMEMLFVRQQYNHRCPLKLYDGLRK